MKDDPTKLGAAIALILLSTFYGLFLAVPTARGLAPILMMALCQFGVLISLTGIGIPILNPGAVDTALLKMIAAFSIVSVLIGLIIFDIRKLHRRLSGVAVFGMVFAYIQILSNLTRPYATLFDLLFATTIPPLIAVLFLLPIRKLQDFILKETC